jgi:hypothetical protein
MPAGAPRREDFVAVRERALKDACRMPPETALA